MRRIATAAFLLVSVVWGYAEAQDREGEDPTEFTPAQKSALASLPRNKGAANPQLEMVREESQRIVGTLKGSLTTPSMAVNTWVVVVPQVPSFDGQQVIDQATSLDAEEIVDQSPEKRPLLRSKVKVAAPETPSTSSYESAITVQLYSRKLKRRSQRHSDVQDLLPSERDRYLVPDRYFDYESEAFRAWKEQHGFVREKRESEFAFAHRVFQTITTDYSYQYEFRQERTATNLCQLNETDCGGLSILFTTVMRSEAIPARTLVGRWAKSASRASKRGGDRDDAFHVIAEFFAKDIGWIPVDAASAVLHDNTPTKTKYFGIQAGNFVTFHFDQEVLIDTDLWGVKPMGFVQMPKYWFRGKGAFDDIVFKHDWIVEKVSAKPDDASLANSKIQSSGKSVGKPSGEQPNYVFLPLVHLRQGERLCAPTSASIVLLRYGMQVPPQQIKQLANSVTTKPEFSGTYFKDLVDGLEKMGVVWTRQHFATDADGFAAGMAVIEKSLREGRPVIVDTYVPPGGHTVVINGFDPNRKLISIVDPLMAAPGLRSITYAEFERSWRSVISDVRGCILTAPKSF
ncbi:transglutaminase domain protein [Rhodopirellula maiorica SM1]|uniref:Transglutaminase domain protein n=1 Tax=Rhodopirellula maiorica SM1 TaxID=1265738 RepID=M5RH84_9BACT|nr:transglutaminase domain-containing protein [Rhodopirellula maiorica]EMI18728.1 transglutaminase domain protein [Rhodopirellula maiorica SM1]